MRSTFIYLLLCLLFSCVPVKYNSVDMNNGKEKLGLEPPVDIIVSQGNYRSYVMITWVFYKQLSMNFHIYRSEQKDDGFILLSDEVIDNYYYDKTAIPSITYYYKIRAVSLLNGESDFSEPVSGSRAGIALDEFENAEKTTTLPMPEFDIFYQRSIYPEGEEDIIRIDCKKHEIYTYTIMQSDNYNTSLYDFSISFYYLEDYLNKTGSSLLTVDSFKVERTFTITASNDMKIVGVLKSLNPEITGDYSIKVSKLNNLNLIENIQATDNYSGYIKINWKRASFYQYYIVERKVNDGEWEQIEVSTNVFRRDTVEKITTSSWVYDYSASSDTLYEYRVTGYINAGFYRLSTETALGKKNSCEPDVHEPDNSIETAKTLTLPTLLQERTLTSNLDNDYIKVQLENSKTYRISISSISPYKTTLSLMISDASGDMVYHSPPYEDSEINIEGLTPSKSGLYSICINTVTNSGAYRFSMSENND